MFDLVADVERYPQFVPLCQSLTLRRRSTNGEGKEVIVADMTVAYKFIRETFTSRVTLDRANFSILVEYLEGPFRRMNNRWSFHPNSEASCDVDFFLAYEFRSRALGIRESTLRSRIRRACSKILANSCVMQNSGQERPSTPPRSPDSSTAYQDIKSRVENG